MALRPSSPSSSTAQLLPTNHSQLSLVSIGPDAINKDKGALDASYGFQTYDSYLASGPIPLPPLSETRSCLGKVRYQVASVYRRLFSIVFLANIMALIIVVIFHRSITAIFNAVAANLAVSGLIRVPQVTNQIYRITTCVPRSAPFSIRRKLAKVSHYGGVHSGCGVAAFFWYIAAIAVFTLDFVLSALQERSVTLLALLYLILLLLAAIIIAAHPTIRIRYHDQFEFTHRFAAWTVQALFWVVIILFAHKQADASDTTMANYLATFPAFYFNIISTITTILPWLRLRRVRVTPSLLSLHASRLYFSYSHPAFSQAISISRHPLGDWHAFACIPDTSTNAGFSLLVSKAGDWTGSIIHSPPTYLWKRNIPAYSFFQTMLLFSRSLVIATGSGIGPCLSLLSAPSPPALRILWQTRAPLETYGAAVLESVRALDGNALVVDTDVHGRQEMLPIAWSLAQKHGAEAVFVVARPDVVRSLVWGFEARGVPAYGPIFDS